MSQESEMESAAYTAFAMQAAQAWKTTGISLLQSKDSESYDKTMFILTSNELKGAGYTQV